ncbi:MAG: hypothetical protein HYV42_03405 [Candidatus Magasanikbacteria bacterium]|nr:hypothetical protein [Candidatus Magasanikbacteria bacterium]
MHKAADIAAESSPEGAVAEAPESSNDEIVAKLREFCGKWLADRQHADPLGALDQFIETIVYNLKHNQPTKREVIRKVFDNDKAIAQVEEIIGAEHLTPILH